MGEIFENYKCDKIDTDIGIFRTCAQSRLPQTKFGGTNSFNKKNYNMAIMGRF